MAGALSLNLEPGTAESLEPNDYVRSIFEREMGVTLHNLKAGSPRDEAMRNLTKEATNFYAKRVLRELIQNAFDGAAGAEEPRIMLRLDLRSGRYGTLYIANNGNGFTKGNVNAVVSPAMSNKTPGNFIGHKGLGFRSVELLSDDVQIFSMQNTGAIGAGRFDGFCFRFAHPEDEEGWLRARGEGRYAADVVGRVHRLQLPVPILYPDPDTAQFAGDGYATLIKLPLRDETACEQAADEMRLLFDEKAPITLFLDRLSSLTIERVDSDGAVEVRSLNRRVKKLPASSQDRRLTLEEVLVHRKRFLIGRMEVDDAGFRESVEAAIQQQHPVDRWKKWEGTPAVSIALALSSDAQPGTFYAFLPMDRVAPFNGCIDAPFYPDANRRDLNLSNPLNRFLLDQVAELCLAVAETLADAEETRPEFLSAAIDAIAWTDESERLLSACERMGLAVGALRLPAMRRRSENTRWARLDVILDWNDGAFQVIDRTWLVKVCDVPMLPRKLGQQRAQALAGFVAKTDFTLDAAAANWAEWAPALAADLAKRKKLVRGDWENFYADLVAMPEILEHLRGRHIFRMADGKLAAANSPDAPEGHELFISPSTQALTRRRQRLAGTTLFPPESIAKKMVFADPALSWQPAVTKAFFDAQLATEYSLPRVLSRMGRLLGRRPKQPSIIAALGWAFAAWKSHKTPEVEQALKTANLLLPVERGATKNAANVYFGAAWRDTKGDLLSEFLEAAPDPARSVRHLQEGLLLNWEAWPLRERGTAAEWADFMRRLGVKDGLVAVRHRTISRYISEWVQFRSSDDATLSIEPTIGRYWRRALRTASPWQGFRYQSGNYETGETLYSLPGQTEHAAMSDRAKTAYAKLVVAALADMPPQFLSTTLSRTTGYGDAVTLPSPLAAFLRLAEWIPVGGAEEVRWRRPSACWFAPRSEPLPRFVARIDRPVRDVLDASAPARDLATGKLGLRLWNDPSSAPTRLHDLGEILSEGVAEADNDAYRKEYREAWDDWHRLTPRPALPAPMVLAVQSTGRLIPMTVAPGDATRPIVFLSDGADMMREQLVAALGHLVLSLSAGVAVEAAAALQSSVGGEFRLLSEADLTIRADGAIVVPGEDTQQLVVAGREWLAEIAVLVLEFNAGLSNRNTVRSRQSLYDDFRKLRIVFARRVTVEIDQRDGTLPDVLDGVLAVPHPEYPTLIVQGPSDDLDWSVLARISRGLPMALGRPSLAMPFRVAFLEIDRVQPEGQGSLERPSDMTVALALGHPLARVQEIYRSLRSTNRRLFDLLVPAAHVLLGEGAAFAMLAREDALLEDAEIAAILARNGAEMQVAQRLIGVCRDAEGLDEVRRMLGIEFVNFNRTLSQLGPPWAPLRFEARLKRNFDKRKDARRTELQQIVRDAFVVVFDEGAALDRYNDLRRLDWVTFDDDWPNQYDELTEEVIDAHFATLMEATLPQGSSPADGSLDDVRQRNRTLLLLSVENLRRLTGAWVAKDTVTRTAPPGWSGGAEQLVRDVMTSGALDFRILLEADLPKAMRHAGLWPRGMPTSSDLVAVGLEAADLEMRAREDERARQVDLTAKRSIAFGATSVDGGGEGRFQLVADALQLALASKYFQARSGKAVLTPFAEGSGGGRPGTRTTRGGGEPEYMTEEQRTLLGFAGEFAAYTYLKKTVRNFADSHWISSMGRRFLSLPATQDDDGFDFHVPRSRGPDLYFEVKAHTGDPGYIDLERSQVAAAGSMADGRSGIWSILYITFVRNPELITVHELQNPFSHESRSLYRQSGKQAMRLEIKRS